MAKKVCVLSYLEAEDWRLNNMRPSCKDHSHLSKEEAEELVYPSWMQTRSQNYHPVAKVVGPHHIQYLLAYTYKKVYRREGLCKGIKGLKSTYGPGEPTMQLVQLGV